MSISVVIPSYNSEKLLKDNLNSLLEVLNKYEGKKELIVVDDASEDGSYKALQDYEKNAESLKVPYRYFRNAKNSGFSSTVNRGVSEATGEILILLNTDVLVKPGFLEPLLDHFKNNLVFAVGCMDESVEDGKIVLRGRGIGSWKRGFLVHKLGDLEKNNSLWVSGGSGAFRRGIWNEIGGLNELYNPFYWEDIDLSYRAQKAGYEVLFEKKSTVRHEHEKGAIKSKYTPSQVRKISYRNQFIFVWLNITDKEMLMSHLLWLPYYFVNAVVGLDSSFFMGFFKALLRVGEVYSERQKNLKKFKLKDKEILSKFDVEYA
jgi:GT2 family glycosyltransferase